MNIEKTHIARLLAAISLASLAGCGGDSATTSNFENIDASEPVSDWQLVWSDEFEDSAIDTNKWNFELNCDGGGNNEKQCYTDNEENAFYTRRCVKHCCPTRDRKALKSPTLLRV
eukprot:UN04303